MAHQKYPKYKDSGIEWLGDIPEHWEVRKLKYSDSVNMGQSPKSDDVNTNKIGLPFIQGNAEFGKISPTPKLWCTNANKIANKDDILLSVRAPIGAVNFAHTEIGIGRGLCAITANNTYLKFLYYSILLNNKELNSIGTGSTFKAISVSDVRNIKLILPPKSEQTAIANYLDQKLEKINRFITKKKQLITLLEEQKAAIINDAVTKGLDKTVTMKDSGVEWLDDIPEHWEVRKFKYLNRLISLKADTNLKKIGLENIESNTGKYIETKTIFEGVGVEFQKNDILFGKLRPYLAKVYVSTFNGQAVGDFYVFRSFNFLNTKFSSYCILNKSFIDLVNSSTFGAKMPRVSWDFIANIPMVFPPIEEQKAIVAHIEAETQRIDRTIATIGKELDLVAEYKTALIAEAVTGKICLV